VIIDGISYVKSFRTDLGEEIEQVGIDGTIGRLQSRADGAHR
jgi:ABC-type transporter MlaC component